jgi:hypothetical protein
MSINQLQALVAECNRKGVVVKFVATSVLRDYAGMNDEIGRKLGFKMHGRTLRDKTIIIDRNLSPETKLATLKHELVEMRLMSKNNMPYWNAHKRALKVEHRPTHMRWI